MTRLPVLRTRTGWWISDRPAAGPYNKEQDAIDDARGLAKTYKTYKLKGVLMKAQRKDIVKLFKELGFPMADQWQENRMKKQVAKLKENMAKECETEDSTALLIEIVKARDEDQLEIIFDAEPDEDVDETDETDESDDDEEGSDESEDEDDDSDASDDESEGDDEESDDSDEDEESEVDEEQTKKPARKGKGLLTSAAIVIAKATKAKPATAHDLRSSFPNCKKAEIDHALFVVSKLLGDKVVKKGNEYYVA